MERFQTIQFHVISIITNQDVLTYAEFFFKKNKRKTDLETIKIHCHKTFLKILLDYIQK